jgi:hypothetical protein
MMEGNWRAEASGDLWVRSTGEDRAHERETDKEAAEDRCGDEEINGSHDAPSTVNARTHAPETSETAATFRLSRRSLWKTSTRFSTPLLEERLPEQSRMCVISMDVSSNAATHARWCARS